ncbi:MAG: Spy/CpxP family protein refolding chaperone [Desulfobulbaceae bacterium]|nr:Spy/CpxP family protein refolding chaperone [Desulfobulbaceae bacterium]
MRKLFLLLLLTIVFASPAYSQMTDMPMMGHRDRHERMMGGADMDHMGNMMGMCIEHAEELGLSDDQLTKMNTVHRDMQKKQARFKADLKIAQIDLMEIMEVKDFDLKKAGAAVNKIEGIRTAHHMEMLKGMKEMRNILTDEQFKKMQTMSMKNDNEKSGRKMMRKQ